MATTTTNMSLTKPATTEAYAVGISNTNLDTIDGWAASVTPSAVDKTAAAGSNSSFARSNHVHTRTARGVHVVRTSNQSITDNTLTAIQFSAGNLTKVRDTDSFHSTSANTRLTVPAGMTGVYAIGAVVEFAITNPNTTLYMTAGIRLNGSTVIARMIFTPAGAIGASGYDLQTGVTYSLAAGDYIELVVLQDDSGGAANNVLAQTSYSPAFWMEYLGVSA